MNYYITISVAYSYILRRQMSWTASDGGLLQQISQEADAREIWQTQRDPDRIGRSVRISDRLFPTGSPYPTTLNARLRHAPKPFPPVAGARAIARITDGRVWRQVIDVAPSDNARRIPPDLKRRPTILPSRYRQRWSNGDHGGNSSSKDRDREFGAAI